MAAADDEVRFGSLARVTTVVALIAIVVYGAYVRNYDFPMLRDRSDADQRIHLTPIESVRGTAAYGERLRASVVVEATEPVHDVQVLFPGDQPLYVVARPWSLETLGAGDRRTVELEVVPSGGEAASFDVPVRVSGCKVRARPCPVAEVVEDESTLTVELTPPVPVVRRHTTTRATGLELRSDGLGAVAFGDPAEATLRTLIRLLGRADADSGWYDGTEELCPGDRVRMAVFSNLTLILTETRTGANVAREFVGYAYDRRSIVSSTLRLRGEDGTRLAGATPRSLRRAGLDVSGINEFPVPYVAIEGRGGRIVGYLNEHKRVAHVTSGFGCGD